VDEEADTGAGSADPVDEVIARAAASLEAVDRALGRLLEGTYGTCEVCASPIESALLAEDAVARVCADCAGVRQTAGGQPGGTPARS
jgi:RNA polymerase-binding transcription factor DksA